MKNRQRFSRSGLFFAGFLSVYGVVPFVLILTKEVGHGVSTGGVFSMVVALFLLPLLSTIRGSDASFLRKLVYVLLADAVYLVVFYLYLSIEHPSDLVLTNPRVAIPEYVATLTMAAGILLIELMFLFAITTVALWRCWCSRCGNEDDETNRVERVPSLNFIRAGSLLVLGTVPFWGLIYVTSIVGQRVPTPEEASYEVLIEHLSIKESWPLRLRWAVNEVTRSFILKYRFKVDPRQNVEFPPSLPVAYRLEAMRGLARFGGAAVEPLIEGLSDIGPKVRTEAARSLGTLGRDGLDAVEPLREMLLDPQLPGNPIQKTYAPASDRESFRRELALSLLQIAPGDPESARVVLNAFESVERPDLLGFVEDLTKLSGLDRANQELILKLFLTDGSDPMIYYVLHCLRSFTSEPFSGRDVVESVVELLSHSDPVIRREAVLCLGILPSGSDELGRRISDVILDSHPEVSCAAAYVIWKWGPSSDIECVEALMARLANWGDDGRSLERKRTGRIIPP